MPCHGRRGRGGQRPPWPVMPIAARRIVDLVLIEDDVYLDNLPEEAEVSTGVPVVEVARMLDEPVGDKEFRGGDVIPVEQAKVEQAKEGPPPDAQRSRPRRRRRPRRDRRRPVRSAAVPEGGSGPARYSYVEAGAWAERSTSRVISLGAKTRNGGPQKPVPRLV